MAWEFDSPLGYSQRELAAEYANWQSGQIESLVLVGSTPTSATER